MRVVGLLFLLAIPAPALALTTVSGVISESVAWTKALGPYQVSGVLSVESGATLTIEAGTEVFMLPDGAISVLSGALKVLGREGELVQIRSDKRRLGGQGLPGDWGGVSFAPGASGSRLEHLLIEDGRGLVVRGIALELNSVEIRNHLGVAIDADHAAVLSGAGNRASGNTINAVVVPSGVVSGVANWGLKGIPYYVSSGRLEIGAAPQVLSVVPNTLEQGETRSVVVTGTRLEGVSRATVDGGGVQVTPQAGGGATINLEVKAAENATLGPRVMRILVDAGEIVVANGITVAPPLPSVSAITPNVVEVGAAATQIVVAGRNFNAQSLVVVNQASLSTQYVSSSELRASLPTQGQAAVLQLAVKNPDVANPGEFVSSNALPLTVQMPAPPLLSVEPTPIALPPGGGSHEVTLRLSRADVQDVTLNLAIANSSLATVSPATLTIPAGQVTAKATIVANAIGNTFLSITSARVQGGSTPLFITPDFRGASTSFAQPVGVLVESAEEEAGETSSLSSLPVGLAVGAVISQIQPRSMAVGQVRTLTVEGIGLGAISQVTLMPADDIAVSNLVTSPDGRTLTVQLSATESALVGVRRLDFKDAQGQSLALVNAELANFSIASGLPRIDSMEPIQVATGSLGKLLIRGAHLHNARVEILPSTGVILSATPVVSGDGLTVSLDIQVASGAPKGPRVVRVVTPAGDTGSTASSANTLNIVSALEQAVTPITSPLIGLVVGEGSAEEPPAKVDPLLSPQVGLVVGSVLESMTPRVGVVGTEFMLAFKGKGLVAVNALEVLPAAGISVGQHTINQDGTEIQVTLTIDAGAEKGLRRFVVKTEGGEIPAVGAEVLTLLISAPLPELHAVAPQVILAGAGSVTTVLTGKNFSNVLSVRLEPSQNTLVQGPFVTNGDATTLSFSLSADAQAASGRRVVVVTTAAGESALQLSAGNSLEIAQQLGPTYAGILSPTVGVQVGEAAPEGEETPAMLSSPLIGVLVETPEEVVETPMLGHAPLTGVVVGSGVWARSADGVLQGGSVALKLTGSGLDAVSSVSLLPADDLTVGAPQVAGGGTELTVLIEAAPGAARGFRQLSLAAPGGAVLFVQPEMAQFGVSALPVMTSLAPINVETGSAPMITVRGSQLKDVVGVRLEPETGVRAIAAPTWGQDGFGEFLTIALEIAAGAPTGPRVLRLVVPGGMTSADATPANTLNLLP